MKIKYLTFIIASFFSACASFESEAPKRPCDGDVLRCSVLLSNCFKDLSQAGTKGGSYNLTLQGVLVRRKCMPDFCGFSQVETTEPGVINAMVGRLNKNQTAVVFSFDHQIIRYVFDTMTKPNVVLFKDVIHVD